MPLRDGTGPFGEGPLTGRGLGGCSKENNVNNELKTKENIDKEINQRMDFGIRRGCRRGFGAGFGRRGRGFRPF